MRTRVLLTTITLVVLSLLGGNNTYRSSAKESVARALLSEPPAVAGGPTSIAQQIVKSRGATKFSSVYTDLTKCGSGMTKKEEKQAEEYGSDIPTRCKGLGGYDIYISYSACASYISLERGEERIPMATQAVDWKQQTVEWRLANGKPFAAIMRVYEYSGDEQCVTGGKITSESLFVQGLKGYEHISEAVDVKETPNPNLKARQIADKGYARGKS